MDENDQISAHTTDVRERAVLDNLQANIIKGHARGTFAALFLNFQDAAEAHATIADLLPLVKSASTHLWEVEAFHSGLGGGTPYVGVGLSQKGLDVLGAQVPEPAPNFTLGMKDRQDGPGLPPMADPPPGDWEPGYQGDLHAVVLIGDASADGAARAEDAVRALLPRAEMVVVDQRGQEITNTDGVGLEHFGYVDGRSQPLFLEEDITAEPRTRWDPAFGLGQLLVPEDGAFADANRFGSFLVFRKLEQNVRLFKEEEERIATDLGLVGPDRERAGAMIVGRFEDGTPLVDHDAATKPGQNVENDFAYVAPDPADDATGLRCPHFAHIRKTNPRGSSFAGMTPEQIADERGRIMARRGITYGERTDDINADLPPSARPTEGVGLLFMAFMRSIEDQFEFTQRAWANNKDFPFVEPDPGLDQVIGQGQRPGTSVLHCPVAWGQAPTQDVDPMQQAVTLKGGEYFYAPSIPFLREL
ncbi:peroxidase [Actinomycetospora sp. NBRC 106375]|uniref:Dyp-type peroxidase n=1 Tax=Actinomycetospora sp. NBRC 106375 TaxID=3032207 RepID=UPI002555BEE9|nr:peroxidase [Actinomycetospora sp. NBRC 106375]